MSETLEISMKNVLEVVSFGNNRRLFIVY